MKLHLAFVISLLSLIACSDKQLSTLYSCDANTSLSSLSTMKKQNSLLIIKHTLSTMKKALQAINI